MQSCKRLSTSAVRTFKAKELERLHGSKGPFRCHFPGSTSLSSSQEPEKRLLVFMVGWAQSKHNALSKYAALYTHLGFPCMAIAIHAADIFFTSRGNRLMDQVFQTLDQSMEKPVTILYHIFSGAGNVVFPRLLQELDKPDSLLSTKIIPSGIVFDSGPTIFSKKSGLAASKLVYDQGGFNFFSYHLSNTVGISLDFAIGSRKRSDLQTALEHPRLLDFPQLYLYSHKDTVCPSEVVEKVMETQRKKGRSVSSHCWTGTDHVRHFSVHPQEYAEKVTEFVKTYIE